MHHNFYHYPRARREGKQGLPILIGTLRLDLDASCVQNNHTLSLEPTPCFLLPTMIKGDKSMIVQTQTLIDLRASTCFIDK